VPLARLAAEAVMVIAAIVCLMLVTGVLNRNLGGAGTNEFGVFSMNLGSPFIPQFSGAIPPLRHYWLGMGSQVFDYMGLGALLVVMTALPLLLRWLRRRGRAHVVLILVLCGYLLFALSDRIRLGSHLLLAVPLPESLQYALGAFRASGRFFWPVGYTLTGLSLLLLLRHLRPMTAAAVLALACLLQVIDVMPIRESIAETASHPAPAVVDRQRLAALVRQSRNIMVYPSFGCAGAALDQQPNPVLQRVYQENMEIQLAAARADVPINSVYTARLEPDCAAETAAARRTLNPGTANFYLTPFTPAAEQLAGNNRAEVCGELDEVFYCLIPRTP
jgi:hypothetical protein